MKLLLCISIIVLGGCTNDDKGFLAGEYLMVRDCKDGEGYEFRGPDFDGSDGYRMTARFLAIDALENVASIRMQPGGQQLNRTDALIVQINDVSLVKDRVGLPLSFDGPHVRGALHLMGSCPDNRQSLLAANGSVTFTEFSVRKGDDVAAEFSMSFIDERSQEVVGLDFEGQFEFTVKSGPPYQPFVP